MTKRDFYVSHSRDGFTVSFVEKSRFRDGVQTLADYACAMTGHLFEGLYLSIWKWADKKEKPLAIIDIDRATADRLAYHPDSWSYLDDPEEDKPVSEEAIERTESSDSAGNQHADDPARQTS